MWDVELALVNAHGATSGYQSHASNRPATLIEWRDTGSWRSRRSRCPVRLWPWSSCQYSHSQNQTELLNSLHERRAHSGTDTRADIMKVAILPEPTSHGEVEYRAIAGGRQAIAKTAGAALDAVAAQLPADAAGTLVIVQNHRPDPFFTARQQERLAELMARWRAARDAGSSLPPAEQAELDALVEAEVRASGERAATLLADLAK